MAMIDLDVQFNTCAHFPFVLVQDWIHLFSQELGYLGEKINGCLIGNKKGIAHKFTKNLPLRHALKFS